MKVVIFCGGLGMRIRETDSSLPKPMIEIGYRPILWHVMKYYDASSRVGAFAEIRAWMPSRRA